MGDLLVHLWKLPGAQSHRELGNRHYRCAKAGLRRVQASSDECPSLGYVDGFSGLRQLFHICRLRQDGRMEFPYFNCTGIIVQWVIVEFVWSEVPRKDPGGRLSGGADPKYTCQLELIVRLREPWKSLKAQLVGWVAAVLGVRPSRPVFQLTQRHGKVIFSTQSAKLASKALKNLSGQRFLGRAVTVRKLGVWPVDGASKGGASSDQGRLSGGSDDEDGGAGAGDYGGSSGLEEETPEELRARDDIFGVWSLNCSTILARLSHLHHSAKQACAAPDLSDTQRKAFRRIKSRSDKLLSSFRSATRAKLGYFDLSDTFNRSCLLELDSVMAEWALATAAALKAHGFRFSSTAEDLEMETFFKTFHRDIHLESLPRRQRWLEELQKMEDRIVRLYEKEGAAVPGAASATGPTSAAPVPPASATSGSASASALARLQATLPLLVQRTPASQDIINVLKTYRWGGPDFTATCSTDNFAQTVSLVLQTEPWIEQLFPPNDALFAALIQDHQALLAEESERPEHFREELRRLGKGAEDEETGKWSFLLGPSGGSEFGNVGCETADAAATRVVLRCAAPAAHSRAHIWGPGVLTKSPAESIRRAYVAGEEHGSCTAPTGGVDADGDALRCGAPKFLDSVDWVAGQPPAVISFEASPEWVGGETAALLAALPSPVILCGSPYRLACLTVNDTTPGALHFTSVQVLRDGSLAHYDGIKRQRLTAYTPTDVASIFLRPGTAHYAIDKPAPGRTVGFDPGPPSVLEISS